MFEKCLVKAKGGGKEERKAIGMEWELKGWC